MKKGYLFSDGASRGNPGPAGAGFVLIGEDGQVASQGKRYLGMMTNNQAEYLALIDGLSKALELGYDEIEINLDSELLVRQINGEYRVKDKTLKIYYKQVMEILTKFKSVSTRHIPREKNKVADRLANEALDLVL